MRGELIKGHLDLLLLSVLEKPLHGYAVIEELRARSGDTFHLPEGTIYPALHRLERDGLINSKWDSSTGRRRRVYQLTAKGRKAHASQQKDWKTFSNAVGSVLRGHA